MIFFFFFSYGNANEAEQFFERASSTSRRNFVVTFHHPGEHADAPSQPPEPGERR